MTGTVLSVDQKPAARVETYLFWVRWILLGLVILVAWSDNGTLFPSIWIWVGASALVNFLAGAWLYIRPSPTPRSTALIFIGDLVLFSLLPLLPGYSGNLLAYFLVFPAFVGAVRFGPTIGLLSAALLALPMEIHLAIPLVATYDDNPLTRVLPVGALLGSTFLIGYLTSQEKLAILLQSASDLDGLCREMAGARLLYRTADSLSSSTSYTPMLEAMLEAGVKGLPPGRHDDGLPVGIALFFDDQYDERQLRVCASRHLDRYDAEHRASGKEGVVAEALRSGDVVLFDTLQSDPELSAFTSLGRCRSGACFPLQAGMEQYGVVILATPAPRRPSEQHLDLMRAFTNQVALAFQNAILYQNLRIEHDQIIRNETEMRQKLAMDLHDGPTQKVAALAMQIEFIERILDENPAEAKLELERARTAARQTVKEIRTSLFALRPLALETKGLSAALEQYCERLRESENVPLLMDAGRFGIELDPNVASTVFAIIDEAVKNARKHAPSSPIQVRVGSASGTLVATIQDKGPGFELDKVLTFYDNRSSLGLQIMRERARLIDGELRIDSTPGQGTLITLIVPHPQRVTRALAQFGRMP